MKKHILLNTTAMLLSIVAMNTKAASNSAELEIIAEFLKPMELISEQYLGFGVMLADEGGKTVIVKNDGTLDPTSTATMISKTSFENDDTGSLNQGLIRNKGVLVGTHWKEVTNDNVNLVIDTVFSHTEVELTDGDISCGTVSDLNTRLTVDGNDVLIHVGGTFTTADLSTIVETASCYGSVTVTQVLNPETLSAMKNAE